MLGKTYGNLMIDVQATNVKLHLRALKAVQTVTGLDRETCEALLQESGGEVKTAILVGKTKLTPGEARAKLAAHGNILRATLDDVL